MKKKPSAGNPTREQALSAVVVKNSLVREQKDDNGEVMLIYPLKIRPLVAGIARRLSGREPRLPEKKLQLDQMGTAVWDLIDEKRSVGKIIKRFARDFQMLPSEAELSVTTFLRELGRRGLIAMK